LNTNQLAIESIKQNLSEVHYATPSFKWNNSEFYATNQVIIKLRNSVSIHNILQNYTNEVVLVKSTKYGTHLLQVNQINQIFTIANQIHESGLVEWCYPNFVGGRRIDNPIYPEQYYLNNTGQLGGTANVDINAPEAWTITEGCGNIRVAVIDEGVEDHEDLDFRVLTGFDPRNPNNPGNPINAGESHGVACAGIIGASNNTIGVRGIASNTLILPIRAFVNGFGYTDVEIAEAINWAWDEGQADVLSNSWGGGPPSQAITQAITNARTLGRNGRGCVVVFASGNGGAGVVYPGNLPNILTIGAINKNGNLWNYSS
jgi:hypothetical protein